VPSIEPNVKEAIESTNWEDIIPRLVLFARARLYQAGWRGKSVGLPNQTFKEPGDYVHEAIKSFLDGDWKWDPNRVSLFKFLCGVISSLISDDVNNRSEVKSLDVSIDEISSQEDSDRWQLDSQSSGLDFAIQREEILNRLRNDPLASRIAELILDSGLYKSSELAYALGIGVEQVHNAKRRMRRALTTWRREHKVQ